MDGDIFGGAADFVPASKYKQALVRIGVELDDLPPLPEVKPVEVADLKKIKKTDLVTAYQSMQAALRDWQEWAESVRPPLENVRDIAEETLLQ